MNLLELFSKLPTDRLLPTKNHPQTNSPYIFRRLNTEKLGVRHDRIQRKETVSTQDIKRIMCSMGPDPIDEDEIEQFLADIGFEDDKFVKITDFAKFLME